VVRALLVVTMLAVVLAVPGPSSAATTDCPDPATAVDAEGAQACLALSERLDALDADIAAGNGQPVSGTVALSADDAQRLDLSWYGAWAGVGVLLVLLVAPTFLRSFRFWSDS
jgi:hypothetical protein